jgi:hypothetical protein
MSDLEVRKSTGSFYTPNDVANFVWKVTLDEVSGASITLKIRNFINNYDVIEPSNGGGAFLFSYLKLLSKNKMLDEWYRSPQVIFSNDINLAAVADFSKKIDALELSNKFSHSNQDGRIFLRQLHTNLRPCIIGNPPYFRQKPGLNGNRYSDIYGDFVHYSVKNIEQANGISSLLVPLSITFSKNFVDLRRQIIEAEMSKKFINFDNMPDYVFKQGKSDSKNTNKAISQRISLITFNANKENDIRSTALISWKTKERKKIFSTTKTFFETKPFGRFSVLPKPFYSKQIEQLTNSEVLGDYVLPSLAEKGQPIYFGTTARNFLSVGLSEFRSTGISFISIESTQLRNAVFYYLASKTALLHWRAIGDGFHVTKDNLLLMPLPNQLLRNVDYFASLGNNLWKNRKFYKGNKISLGRKNSYFNFTGATDFCENKQA